jgi:hypothetical protein
LLCPAAVQPRKRKGYSGADVDGARIAQLKAAAVLRGAASAVVNMSSVSGGPSVTQTGSVYGTPYFAPAAPFSPKPCFAFRHPRRHVVTLPTADYLVNRRQPRHSQLRPRQQWIISLGTRRANGEPTTFESTQSRRGTSRHRWSKLVRSLEKPCVERPAGGSVCNRRRKLRVSHPNHWQGVLGHAGYKDAVLSRTPMRRV